MAVSEATELLTKLHNMVGDAQDAVRGLHDGWDHYSQFYQGQQHIGVDLKQKDMPDWTPVNLVFSQCETKLPILMDAAPAWYAVSPDGENEDNAKRLSEALQAKWYERNLSRQYKLSLRDQIVLGNGFMKCWWNDQIGPQGPTYDEDAKSEPQGDVDVSWIDPYSVYPDPSARSLEECEFLCLSSDLSEDRAKRLYERFNSEKAECVAVNGESMASMWNRGKAWLNNLLYGIVGDSTGQYRTKQYRVWEVYHDAGAKLTVYSGTNVLYDGANPTPNGRFPVVHFSTYEQGCDFWGMAETSQLIGLQTAVNKQVFRIAKHARLMGNTPWVTDDPQLRVTNTPGEVMRIGLGRFARRDAPPSLPNYIFGFLQLLQAQFDVITGVHDVTRGLKPGSVQSGIGIQQLQEAAQTRLRRSAADNALILQVLGQLVFEAMQARYTGTRSVAYLRGAEPQRVDVTQEMLHNTTASPFDPTGASDVTEPVAYQITVQSGGDLPLNPMAEAELAMRSASVMAEDGTPMIDREAYLEAIRFAGTRALLERVRARTQGQLQGQMQAQQEQAMMAQQQAQMQAQQQGAPMPPSAPQEAPAEGLDPSAQAPVEQAQIAPQGPPPGMEQLPYQMAQPGQEAPPQEDPLGAQGDAIMDQLDELLTPPEMAMLKDLLTRIAQGGQVSDEDGQWLDSLPEEAQPLIAELLGMLGLEMPGEEGPQLPGQPVLGQLDPNGAPQ